jgi:hypothetical protein
MHQQRSRSSHALPLHFLCQLRVTAAAVGHPWSSPLLPLMAPCCSPCFPVGSGLTRSWGGAEVGAEEAVVVAAAARPPRADPLFHGCRPTSSSDMPANPSCLLFQGEAARVSLLKSPPLSLDFASGMCCSSPPPLNRRAPPLLVAMELGARRRRRRTAATTRWRLGF